MKKNCTKCGVELELPDNPFFKTIAYCAKCTGEIRAKAESDAKDEAMRQNEERWRKLCPPAFRDTDAGKLPNPQKAVETMAWEYGPTGLLLHGDTRRGKSRCAWLLIRKVFDAGKTVQVMDSMSGFQYMAAFSNSAKDAQEWVELRSKCGLLFFDDLFKAKLTDSFEAAVFAIVDYRMNHQLPIVATLNDTGETLSSRMSADRGEAFVARLKEMCQIIQF